MKKKSVSNLGKNQTIKMGDLVRVKNGGTTFVVAKIRACSDGMEVECFCNAQRSYLPLVILEKVKYEKPSFVA